MTRVKIIKLLTCAKDWKGCNFHPGLGSNLSLQSICRSAYKKSKMLCLYLSLVFVHKFKAALVVRDRAGWLCAPTLPVHF
jgi:hypothetical protein